MRFEGSTRCDYRWFIDSAGAGRGTRTPTVSLPADFESAASTSSAIPATRQRARLWGARLDAIISQSPLSRRRSCNRRSRLHEQVAGRRSGVAVDAHPRNLAAHAVDVGGAAL